LDGGGSRNSPVGVEKLWIDGCSMIAGVKVEGKKSKRYKDN
jgi:hypothetical protein